MTTTERSRSAVCDRCGALILVVGKKVDDDAALRRADWARDGDGRVTCRRCLQKQAT
jgi:hypothetical protein